MTKLFTMIGVALFLMTACINDGKPRMSETERARYDSTLMVVQDLERALDGVYSADLSQQKRLWEASQNLYYNYNPMDMDSAAIALCQQLKDRIRSLYISINETLEDIAKTQMLIAVDKSDYLMETTEAFPLYLHKDDVLRFNVSMEKPCNVRIYNADSRSLLKSYMGKTTVNDTLLIKNTAIYLVEVNPRTTQYASLGIAYSVPTLERYMHPQLVETEMVEGQKGGFRVLSTKGINMKDIFDEPRSFTLRSQFKSIFSGNSRALVALQIPKGATDVMYSLRISTSEQACSADGEFYDNMSTSYRKIRFLGLPLYESQRGIGLLGQLLDDNRPLREEDAYCDMYVFADPSQARRFQNGESTSELKYNVDYSTMGTQSCNGRIPTQGLRTIYLGFENARLRYTTYIWVEAVAAIPVTEYFQAKYTVVDMPL